MRAVASSSNVALTTISSSATVRLLRRFAQFVLDVPSGVVTESKSPGGLGKLELLGPSGSTKHGQRVLFERVGDKRRFTQLAGMFFQPAV
jgi:hypothetical protein